MLCFGSCADGGANRFILSEQRGRFVAGGHPDSPKAVALKPCVHAHRPSTHMDLGQNVLQHGRGATPPGVFPSR